MSYINQSEQTMLSIRLHKNNSKFEVPSVKEWVAGTLLEKQIGCKMKHPFSQYQCLVECHTRSLVNLNPELCWYLLDSDILPLCYTDIVKAFNLVLSNKVLRSLDKIEANNETCNLKCQNNSTNSLIYFPPIVPFLTIYYSTSINVFFITIGGVISLCLGFSLLDVSFSLMFNVIKYFKHTKNLNKRILKFLKIAVIFCSFIGTLLFCHIQQFVFQK